MTPKLCMSTRHVALAVAAALTGAVALVSVAPAATPTSTSGQQQAPVYEFLVRSGLSKRAKAEAAIVSGVVTVRQGRRLVATSTVRAVHKPEILEALQASIFGGTPVEPCETKKVGTLELTYDEGTTITVVIYEAYYEITTSVGTIRFTSEPLTAILRELLK